MQVCAPILELHLLDEYLNQWVIIKSCLRAWTLMKTVQDIGILVKEIEPKQIFKDPKLFVAFGFGSGLSKIAPGTMGSLVATFLWYPLSLLPFGVYALFLVACFYLGISVCGYASVLLEKHDYGGIVFDEFLGIWIALLTYPVTLHGIAVVFLLFRIFDIWKPWPISYVDGKVKGGIGVMLDDVLAGFLTLMIVGLIKGLGIPI